MFYVGGVERCCPRALAEPGSSSVADQYNQIFTLHGPMIFLS